MPLVIGITATPERFNRLVEGLDNTTIHKVTTTADEVRASGLLKDRIIIEYPDTLNNEMAVLQAATDEWVEKCAHWEQYCREQHHAYVDPVFVVQVQNGSGQKLSDTDLEACLETIEKRAHITLKEHEVVHTFGQSAQTLHVGGLPVHYEEPSHIAENRKIKLVFFKENLSTGWDCPRAETMMSFRRANDATYIAQLLGRMVRTPMQMRIKVDETLNDVRLFLPYFNADTVKDVVESLQSTEGSNIPTDIVGQQMGEKRIETLTVNIKKQAVPAAVASQPAASSPQPSTFTNVSALNAPAQNTPSTIPNASTVVSEPGNNSATMTNDTLQFFVSAPQVPTATTATPTVQPQAAAPTTSDEPDNSLDRKGIIEAINRMNLLTYDVRTVKIRNYLSSLYDLSRLLTRTHLNDNVHKEVIEEVVERIHHYVQGITAQGEYDNLTKKVMEFKFRTTVVDVFGQKVNDFVGDLFSTTDVDIDRQFRQAEMKLGNEGVGNRYCDKYYDDDNPISVKIDTILFANDTDQTAALEEYAMLRFHDLADKFRLKTNALSERDLKKYNDIISNGDVVSKHNLNIPESIQILSDMDGDVYDNHLLANSETGKVRFKLNEWEKGVIAEEAAQHDFVCWLRNIPRKPWALTIPYRMDGHEKPTYPDFIVITKDDGGEYVINVLEPHDPSRNDNLPKAKGFAEYAKQNPAVGRLELIRGVKDISGLRFKRLDLTRSLVQGKVLATTTDDMLSSIFDEYGYFM